jgi:predicted ABC-type ATPase
LRSRKKTSGSSSTRSNQLRLRVFAGPNGSGKSTVIDYVRNVKIGSKSIDFGYYINADDIADQLRKGNFSFEQFNIVVSNRHFMEVAFASGLINDEFTKEQFKGAYSIRKNHLKLKDFSVDDRMAQIVADFLRKELLKEKRKFSFETVFSHSSKLEIMREAIKAGYKVYLYFVSTESPDINKFRVEARVKLGGHDVPVNKITSRYYRSLELLHEACQLGYQVFFFDNSKDDQDSAMFAHFKIEKGKKKWDAIDQRNVPQWFKDYYISKVKLKRNYF